MTTTLAATRRAIEAVWRIESAKVVAHNARLVRDVGLAEELAQDALVTALDRLRATAMTRNERERELLLARAASCDPTDHA